MKKQDLKAGVIYGFAQGTSDYRTAYPLIVLDAKGLWTWYRPSNRENRQWKVSFEKRFTSGSGGWSSYYGDHGYLVLHGSRYADEERQAQNLAELKELYADFAQTAGNPDAVEELAVKVKNMDGIYLDVVNNRWITGDYVETKNEEVEREAARQAERKAERDRSAAEREFMDDVAEVLAAKLERPVTIAADHGYGQKRASISFNDLAEFFGVTAPRDRL